MLNQHFRQITTESDDWSSGYIEAEDTHCIVFCDCDYAHELSVSDYQVTVCPHCGKGYITEFNCYRIPAEFVQSVKEFIMYKDGVIGGGYKDGAIGGGYHKDNLGGGR